MEKKEISSKDLKETLSSKIFNMMTLKETSHTGHTLRHVENKRRVQLIKFSSVNYVCFYIDTFEMIRIITPLMQMVDACRREGGRG